MIAERRIDPTRAPGPAVVTHYRRGLPVAIEVVPVAVTGEPTKAKRGPKPKTASERYDQRPW